MPKIKSESAWFKSKTPISLFQTLKGKKMPRQRRLIAVEACLPWIAEMQDRKSRQAVEVADRFLNGVASADELEQAFLSAQKIAEKRIEECHRATENKAERWNAWRLCYAAQLCATRSGSDEAALEILKRTTRMRPEADEAENVKLCELIRDIVGNPFRPVPKLDPVWLSWNESVIGKLARSMYETRQFKDMPILGDALEEAGCDDEQVLTHCRSTAEHVRGCWVIDWVLAMR
jgi:hypothetical protein